MFLLLLIVHFVVLAVYNVKFIVFVHVCYRLAVSRPRVDEKYVATKPRCLLPPCPLYTSLCIYVLQRLQKYYEL